MPGKVKYHKLNEKERKKILDDFYSIIASLNSKEEVKRFFKDLLTLSEAVMVSRRIQIAKMLLSGKTQEEIRSKLKAGFNNINQVEKWLNNGFGGYKLAIKKLYGTKKVEKTRNNYYTPYTFDWLRKKHPLHFALINLLLKDKK